MRLFGDRMTNFRSRLIAHTNGGVSTQATYLLNGEPACSRVPWALDHDAMYCWIKERRKGADLWARGRA